MSTKPYPNYKSCDIEGVHTIPESWEVNRVCDIVTLVNGFPFDSDLFNRFEGVPLVRIRDLNSTSTETYFGGSVVAKAIVTSADVLIGMDGDFNVGRWLGEGDALLNQRMCCLRGPSDVTRLLEYALSNPLRRINDVTYSTTVKHLSSGQVKKIRVALPATTSQRREVADFLDRETAKIDALVVEQERLLVLLAEKRQAVISRAVTQGLDPSVAMKDSGVEWLGRVPAHWSVTSLNGARAPGSTITYGIVQAGPDVEGGVPYIRTSDMSGFDLAVEGYLRTTSEIAAAYDRSRVEEGDLVVAIRATVGKTLIVPSQLAGANLTQGTAKVSPDKSIIADFLFYVLNSALAQQQFSAISKGVTFKEITLEALRKFKVPRPSVAEQLEIISHLKSRLAVLDDLTSEATQASRLLRERRAALVSAAVTGKIDVRGLVPTREPEALESTREAA